MIFNFNFKSKIIGIPALALWIAGLLICLVIAIHLGRSFSNRVISKEEHTLLQPENETLYVKLKKGQGTEEFIEYGNNIMFGRWNMVSLKNNFVGIPRLKFINSDSDSFQLSVYKSSRGIDFRTAKTRADAIIYKHNQKDSTLILDPYFRVPEDALWRGQKVKIIIKVPEGKKIKLGEEASMFFDYNFNSEYIYQSSYLRHEAENNVNNVERKDRLIKAVPAKPRKIRSITGINLFACPVSCF